MGGAGGRATWLVVALLLVASVVAAPAGRVRTVLTFGLAPDYWKTYRDEVRKVQLSDIRAMAKKYMSPVPVVVIVGRADKVESQIKEALKDATIVHYNTDLECIDKSPFCAANKPLAATAPAPAPAPTPAPAPAAATIKAPAASSPK